MDPLNQLSLGFIKQSGMADYFKSHLSDLGVETEILCFAVYHWGQWGLSKFRYGEHTYKRNAVSDGDLTDGTDADRGTLA